MAFISKNQQDCVQIALLHSSIKLVIALITIILQAFAIPAVLPTHLKPAEVAITIPMLLVAKLASTVITTSIPSFVVNAPIFIIMDIAANLAFSLPRVPHAMFVKDINGSAMLVLLVLHSLTPHCARNVLDMGCTMEFAVFVAQLPTRFNAQHALAVLFQTTYAFFAPTSLRVRSVVNAQTTSS